MNLEILSFDEAVNYIPEEKTYAIRIHNSFQIVFNHLVESDNWKGINKYFFDDMWPKDWKEYSWIDLDDPYFSGTSDKKWSEIKKDYPKLTKEYLISFYESEGHPVGRHTLFDEDLVKKIMNDFEEVKEDVDCLLIHCNKGENRAPAVGIALNEIYGLGHKNLKEKFPLYRRFVYNQMIEVSKNR